MGQVRGKLAELWESYAARVLPQNASAIQVQECRRAFYAGAGALLAAIASVLGPGDEPTEDDLRAITAIQVELNAFALDTLEGRA